MMAVVLFLLLFFGVPLVCWLAVRVARDMDARGEAGWRYGLLVLCLPPFGLVAWLAARTRRPLPES
ncbi:MAG: hypothetical protein ACRDYF_19115 [Acidimicrobiia bacterium]